MSFESRKVSLEFNENSKENAGKNYKMISNPSLAVFVVSPLTRFLGGSLFCFRNCVCFCWGNRKKVMNTPYGKIVWSKSCYLLKCTFQ